MRKIRDNLYEFDPQIYPRLLWIGIGRERFKDVFERVPDFDEDSDANVVFARRIETKRVGFLVRFESADAINYGNVSHEAGHVALDLFHDIEATIEYRNQEPFTYLLGWIGKCIEKVKIEVEGE